MCGSNGRTYNNLCLLELEACQTRLDIQVVSQGRCSQTMEEESEEEGQGVPLDREDIFGFDGAKPLVPVICKRTEFTCMRDQMCISYIQRCDGSADCPDGQVRPQVTTVLHVLSCRMSLGVVGSAVLSSSGDRLVIDQTYSSQPGVMTPAVWTSPFAAMLSLIVLIFLMKLTVQSLAGLLKTLSHF